GRDRPRAALLPALGAVGLPRRGEEPHLRRAGGAGDDVPVLAGGDGRIRRAARGGTAGVRARARGACLRARRDRRAVGVLPRARDRHDEHRRADRLDGRRAAGDRRTDRRRQPGPRARGRSRACGRRHRAGIARGRRGRRERAPAAPEHPARDRRRGQLRIVLRARRDRLQRRRGLGARALARVGVSDHRDDRAARAAPRRVEAARCHVGRAGGDRAARPRSELLLQLRLDDRRAVERRGRELAVSGHDRHARRAAARRARAGHTARRGDRGAGRRRDDRGGWL
ncbi:MAG: hypothetical protein AVDCRST_MAG67-2686, partial [uncultured Solirubrobacteraceae bacterium]